MLLNEEQQLVRDTMRAFAQERLAPNAARWDRESHFPARSWRSWARWVRWAWSFRRNGAAPAPTTCRSP